MPICRNHKLTFLSVLALAASAPGLALAQGQLPDNAGKGLSITYLSAPIANPVYGAVACGAKTEAARLGVNFKHQESQDFNAASQLPDINAAVASGPSALLVTPADPHGLIAPLDKIVSGGIPVITTVNELSDASGVTGVVAVDNYSAGQLAAKFIVDAAKGAKVTVAAISFQAGSSLATDDELKGFEASIAKFANVTYLGVSYVADGAGPSTETMNALLAREPDLFGVFTTFPYSAQGILASVRQRGVKPVIVAGYSAQTPELVTALGTGQVSAILDFPFRDAGVAALDMAVTAVLRKPLERRQALSSLIYTQKDAATIGQACPS